MGFTNIENAVNSIVSEQPAEVKDWIIDIDKLLVEHGCKVKFKDYGERRGGVMFDYHSKKAKTRVCTIRIGTTLKGTSGCKVAVQGNHFPTRYSIVNELPEQMLMQLKNSRDCRPCADPRRCLMTGRYYEFSLDGKSVLCCGNGFTFKLNEDAEFGLLQKWIENELNWAENDSVAFPEKRVTRDMVSSHDKRWSKGKTKIGDKDSIYEKTNLEQRSVKPPIEGACEYFLKDKQLLASFTQLVEFTRKLGMEIKWKSKNKYVCRYKKVEAVSFRIEGFDDFNVTTCVFGWHEKRLDFEGFVRSLPNEKRAEFLGVKAFHCHACRETCNVKVEIDGCVLCSRASYVCENPAPEQLEEIGRMIALGAEYIDFKNLRKQE